MGKVRQIVKQTILKGINFDNTAELGEYSVTNYVQQSVTHGQEKLKRAVYEHSVKATFYHPEILERNETTPKLRQLHAVGTGCMQFAIQVCQVLLNGEISTAVVLVV